MKQLIKPACSSQLAASLLTTVADTLRMIFATIIWYTPNTNSSFENTNSSFENTNSSFENTNSSFENLATCNRLVIMKLEQAMRTYPDIGLVKADLLQLARF